MRNMANEIVSRSCIRRGIVVGPVLLILGASSVPAGH